ncbi:MAG: AAA family ATPase, partial [Oscillospiraceae bacterium]|nr:AAA family ATPase [Oscillospiraceae bacterium]
MLQLIHIENIAVIERAELAFGSGFNVLTGETGAGKSIVIDALNAVTGGRVTRELVRTGTAAAAVTAVFTGADVSGWLEDNGIDPDDDGGELVLSRRVSSDGKSVCRVNGTPVSAAQLRELGGTLVDIHGQNDGRKLLDDAAHRAYLDAFGGYPELLAEYAAAYAAVQVRRREMESAVMDESEKERRADTLRYQIDELERAELSPGETDALSERRELLRNSSHLTSALDAAYSALYGGEDTDGAAALITGAQADMDGAARYSGSFAALAGRLRDLRYAVQDAAEELREKRDALDFSPEELDRIDGRLDTLRRVTRKYGGGEDEALLYLEKCRAELGD